MPEEIKVKLTLDDAEIRKNLEDQEGSGVKRSQGGLFRKRARESADASEKSQREKRGGLLAGAKARFPTLPGIAKGKAAVAGIQAVAQSVTVIAPLVAEAVVELLSAFLPESLEKKLRETALKAVSGFVDVVQSGQAKLGAGVQTIQEAKDLLRGIAAADGAALSKDQIGEVAKTLFDVNEFRIRNRLEFQEVLSGAEGRQVAGIVTGFIFGSAKKDSVDGFDENMQEAIKQISWFGGAGR